MSIESRLTDVEESLRLLRDADRLQGRRFSAEAPDHGDLAAWNATTKKWEPVAGITVPYRDVTELIINDDSDETAIFSYTIPANNLGADGMFRFTVMAEYRNNSSVNRTLTVRVKFGGTEIMDNGLAAIATDAANRAFRLDGLIANRAAGNQRADVAVLLSAAGSPSTGVGEWNVAPKSDGLVFADAIGIDTTAAKLLEVTIQHSAAHGALTFTREIALGELIAPS